MARRKVARLAGVACVSAILLGTQASAMAVPTKPVPAPAPASALAAPSGTASTPASAEGLFCTFYTNGDYVHISSTAFEASGHGWWTNVDCDTAYADVTVQLQEYYSDGSWRDKGIVGRARVRSGGGAGNRATGRAACESGAVTGWRSVVDVDLVGLADSPDKLYTPGQNIGCRRFATP